ncbi:MAG: hypothetical protein ACI865_002257 [Flavobacteriaceae bacterium]|jgi:hypothetical protein
MTLKSIFSAILLALIVSSCTNDPLEVDVSGISVDIEYIDMDAVFVNSDSATLVKKCVSYKKNIKDVYEYQLGRCLQMGDLPLKDLYDSIQSFLKLPYTVRLEKAIAKEFSDKTEMEEKITDGFKHLSYHFPDKKLPSSIVFLNSAFAGSAISMEDDMAIGLDRYLGKESPVIRELPSKDFYDWIKEAMDRQFLERDVMASWIMTNIIEQPSGSLVENIIYWGKVNYFIEACYPDDEEHIIIRYNQEDYDWAIEHEILYWEYLVDQNMLFKLDERTQMNMLKEGPFTPGLPDQAPDRLGQFLGWRMVKQYMANHSDLKLSDLAKKDYNSILQEYEIE